MSSEAKVVQITSMVVPGMDNVSGPSARLIALRDDGSMWEGDGYGWWSEIQGPQHLVTRNTANETRDALLEIVGAETYERVKDVMSKAGVHLPARPQAIDARSTGDEKP